VTLGYLISRSPYLIKVFEPLLAGFYSVPDHPVPAALRAVLRPRPGIEDRARHHHQLLPIVLNTIAGFGYCRQDLSSPPRARWAPPTSRCSATCCCRPALPVMLTGLRIGFTVALLSILGSETIASLAGPRPPHRASGRGDGDGADVCLHRVCRGDRGISHTTVSTLERRAKRR
jgi:ABC-type proline/glycine betaine transport system permease subunit